MYEWYLWYLSIYIYDFRDMLYAEDNIMINDIL